MDLKEKKGANERISSVLNSHKESQRKLRAAFTENPIIGDDQYEKIKSKIQEERKHDLERQKYLNRFKDVRFQYLISPKHENYDSILKEDLSYPVVPDRLLPNKTDVAYERDGIPQLV